ncbi:hypothetical protein HY988_00670 [Candidatus Micrarchaeota archaeon]|nr:hypothetical protein [Candidatus Micrarchaeota archaeon]
MEIKKKIKILKQILEQLREHYVFVEGKRDKIAMRALGCLDVLTIAGNLNISCDKVQKLSVAGPIFVLTDLDEPGNELAILARDELESRSIKADISTRRTLGRILNIRQFEDAKRGYDELMKEYEDNN